MKDYPDSTPVTPEEIIHLILEEMRAEIAPIHYTNLVRSSYHVYLYDADFERLQPVLQRIREEAIRALQDELSRLNKAKRQRLTVPILNPARKTKRYEALGDWVVEFHENTDDDASENPLIIHSAFAAPATADDRVGTLTERITKRHADGQITSTLRSDSSAETRRAGGVVYASIDYEDDAGARTYQMTKDQIKIGRGAVDRWVDLKLSSKKDVSREHVQVRRDPETGRFFIKDLSTLGTTVNGKRIPASIQRVNGQEVDKNIEVPLPDKAGIGLAGVLSLNFKSAKQK